MEAFFKKRLQSAVISHPATLLAFPDHSFCIHTSAQSVLKLDTPRCQPLKLRYLPSTTFSRKMSCYLAELRVDECSDEVIHETCSLVEMDDGRNRLLGSEVPSGTIYYIYGKSGTGKTSFVHRYADTHSKSLIAIHPEDCLADKQVFNKAQAYSRKHRNFFGHSPDSTKDAIILIDELDVALETQNQWFLRNVVTFINQVNAPVFITSTVHPKHVTDFENVQRPICQINFNVFDLTEDLRNEIRSLCASYSEILGRKLDERFLYHIYILERGNFDGMKQTMAAKRKTSYRSMQPIPSIHPLIDSRLRDRLLSAYSPVENNELYLPRINKRFIGKPFP